MTGEHENNTDRPPSPQETATPPRATFPSRYRVLALALVLVAAVMAAWLVFSGDGGNRKPATVSISNKPVIAVLPFKNLSDDVGQDYFSDGITADLIADLSRVSGLSVIARNSVFMFKDADLDVHEVRQDLSVDYMVTGSIRKDIGQVSISARLIDANNNTEIWADHFDGTLEDIFGFQDAITEKIIESLGIRLADSEHTQHARKYGNNVEAYDLLLLGLENLWLSSREGTLQARDYFQQIIELDGHIARAYANLAVTYLYDHQLGWSGDSVEALREAYRYADMAIAIDPDMPQAYWVKGFADNFRKDYRQALENARKALDIDPNFADAYGLLATTLNYTGKPDKADIELRKAMRLNPMHPAIYKVIHGEIFFNKHQYAKAIGNFSFALQSNPDNEDSLLWLAAAYAHVGEIDEAAWQLEQIRSSGGDLSMQHINSVIPFSDPKQRKHFLDGLYMAGLKE